MHSILLLLVMLVAGCAGANPNAGNHRLISPEGHTSQAHWSDDDKARAYAVRNLRANGASSFHMLRVKTERPAVVHEHSDLTMLVVSGALRITLGGQAFEVTAGDVIEVPSGTGYSLRNLAPTAAAVYLVYTPALDPDDSRPATQARSQSAWKWNLWVQ